MIVTSSFFVGDINIANADKPEVLSLINFAINKYEPECLNAILGYPLFKAFISNQSDQRMQDLLNGVEYLDDNNFTQKWVGLLEIISGSTSNVVSDFTLRESEQIKVDVTPGLISGTNTFTFDGTDGKPDYRGEKPVFNSEQTGVLIEDLDYTWDITNGIFLLIEDGDVFFPENNYVVTFNPKQVNQTVANAGSNLGGLVACYIYYKYNKVTVHQTTGFGTQVLRMDSAITISPAIKMLNAYNFFSRRVKEMIAYLTAQSVYQTYPEFTSQNKCYSLNFSEPINDFDI